MSALLFVDVGWLGSPIDLATFVMVLVTFVYQIEPQMKRIAFAVVALAKADPHVDELQVARDLDVDPSHVGVRALRTDGKGDDDR